MSQIKITTNDKETFTVDLEIAKSSETIKTMLEHLGADGLDEEEIPLPNVDGKTFSKVLEFLTHHKDDPIPTDEEIEKASQMINSKLSDWDQQFLDAEQDNFFQLTLAANYLEINSLLDACCKYMANYIKVNKDVEGIRQKFNIKPPNQDSIDTDNTPMEEKKDESMHEEENSSSIDDRQDASAGPS